MQLPYEVYVGLRYLRAKRRQRTISLNTFVSVTGITLGVAALIGTLGIMTGFKEDVQAKIIGTTSHIIVQDRTKDGIEGYTAQVQQVEQVPRVVSATPSSTSKSCSAARPACRESSCAASIPSGRPG